VQNDTGCVDYGPQRIAEGATEFIPDRRFHAGQCDRESVGIEAPGGNFRAHIAEHDATGIGDCGLAVVGYEIADPGLA
jgi:hypothetical protein